VLPINFRTLNADTDCSGFVCGDAEIDKWFRNKALRDHDRQRHLVTCVRFDGSEEVIGFYALSTVVENAKKLPDVKFFPLETDAYFPCIQLVYLAISATHQNDLYGTEVIGDLIRRFAEIGAFIGIPAMIVTPLNEDAARFYKRLGFLAYPTGKRLVLPWQAAMAIVREAEEEVAADSIVPATNPQPAVE
jgi:GNAT superfamily N-acetyltransferase